MKSTPILICGSAAALGLLAASPAAAQTYTVSQGSGSWSSIANNGTATALTFPTMDDDTTQVTLPFDFSFFGSTVASGTQLYASTNGLLSFNGAQNAYMNEPIPFATGPHGFVAGFWRDLIVGTGAAWTQVSGLTGSRILTVEWSNFGFNGATDIVSFQIQLFEGTNLIQVQFGPNTPGTAMGGATVGVEDTSGSVGSATSCTPNCPLSALPNGTLVTFTPGTMMASPDLVVSASPWTLGTITAGQSYMFDSTATNQGTAGSGATSVGLFLSTTNNPPLATDLQIGSADVAALSAGQSGDALVHINVPADANGTYFAALIIDPTQTVNESSFTNNTYNLGQITVMPAAMAITILTNSVPAGQVGLPYQLQFVATSPAASSTWNLVSGAVPGLNLSTSGLLSGTPASAGSYNIQVSCSAAGYTPATAHFTLTVSPMTGNPLVLTTNSLANALVGSAYSGQLAASGGTPPYRFSILNAPAWLSVSTVGALSGTPTSPGSFTLQAEVMDSTGMTAGGALSLSVVPAGGLALATTMLPTATVAHPYSFTLQASGGTPPYHFTVGGRPAWLSAGADGHLSGTPTTIEVDTLMVSLSDSANGSDSRNLPLRVVQGMLGGPLTIDSNAIPAAVNGAPYNYALQAHGGHPPYSWAITHGGLPRGVTLDPGGTIAGIVATTTTASFTVQVTDQSQNTAHATMNFQSAPATQLQIVAPLHVFLKLNASDSFILRARGGAMPYVWTVNGPLPTGLSVVMNADLSTVISGTPTSSVTTHVQLHVQDELGMTATASITVQAILNGTTDGLPPPNTGGGGGGSPGGHDSGGCGCTAARSDATPASPGVVLFLLVLGAVALARAPRARRRLGRSSGSVSVDSASVRPVADRRS
jgi:hypothetical protein